MILVKPSFEIMAIMGGDNLRLIQYEPQKLIERAGRTCYKSEDKITSDSAEKFIRLILKRGHESVIEHSAITVKFVVDRGVSHELVRHRLVAYSQESSRYCNYRSGVTFVIPPWVDIIPREYSYDSPLGTGNISAIRWGKAMYDAEDSYIRLLGDGWTPQQARSVLPNSLKTEIVATTNFREWRHIFKLRCSEAAHPQMREIMIPLRDKCRELIPVIFAEVEE
jgi:thymidylate synthase (FAD)